jgi:hypothetical protein
MIKEREVKQTTKIKEKFCDDCGTKLTHRMYCSYAVCEICGVDLCDKCIGHEDNTMGDYRVVYCKYCWTLYEPVKQILIERGKEDDIIIDECKEKCLKLRKEMSLNALADPDIYEASANDHFAEEVRQIFLDNELPASGLD